MGDFDIGFQRELARQSWSLYGVGMFLILLRMYARLTRLGIKGLQVDDYIMMVAGCLYTVLIVCLNVISQGGGSNLYLPEDFNTFTPEEIQERIQGSKIVIVSEQAMLNVIYCVKSCMLILYSRLTIGLRELRAVKYLAIYVACGWVGTELAFFFACRPFAGYWAMPPPNPQCTTLQHYAITQGTFNISSDCLMLLIPLPLIIRMAVPWRQKIILVFIFSLGIFVILAAILTKVFNLSNVWDPSYMLWYTREASVAIYVSNLPMIWPLLRQWFPFLRTLTPGDHATGSTARPGAGRTGYGGNSGNVRAGSKQLPSFVRHLSDGITKSSHGHSHSAMSELDSGDELDFMHSKGSREAIHQIDEENGGRVIWSQDNSAAGGGAGGMGITKSTTVYVREEVEVEKAAMQGHGQGQGQQKWDWENDGGNMFSARAAGRVGRPSESESDNGNGNGTGPKRLRSLSRPGGGGGASASAEKIVQMPRTAYIRRDTDDEQLSRF